MKQPELAKKKRKCSRCGYLMDDNDPVCFQCGWAPYDD